MQETVATRELRGKFLETIARFIDGKTSSDAFLMELLADVNTTPMLVQEYGWGLLTLIESEFTESYDECKSYTVWVKREMEGDEDADV